MATLSFSVMRRKFNSQNIPAVEENKHFVKRQTFDQSLSRVRNSSSKKNCAQTCFSHRLFARYSLTMRRVRLAVIYCSVFVFAQNKKAVRSRATGRYRAKMQKQAKNKIQLEIQAVKAKRRRTRKREERTPRASRM